MLKDATDHKGMRLRIESVKLGGDMGFWTDKEGLVRWVFRRRRARKTTG